MKKRILQFLTTYFLFVLLFVLQKPIFMAYYHELYTDASIGDYFSVMWHGLPLDFSLAGYLTAIPGFLLIASAWTKSSILRRIRQGYFGIIAFVMSCIFIVDLGLYGFGDSGWMPLRSSISSHLRKMPWQASASGSYYSESLLC